MCPFFGQGWVIIVLWVRSVRVGYCIPGAGNLLAKNQIVDFVLGRAESKSGFYIVPRMIIHQSWTGFLPKFSSIGSFIYIKFSKILTLSLTNRTNPVFSVITRSGSNLPFLNSNTTLLSREILKLQYIESLLMVSNISLGTCKCDYLTVDSFGSNPHKSQYVHPILLILSVIGKPTEHT